MSKLIRNSENAFDPEIRRTYIGGTDAAAICGLSEWKTPFEVWVEKTTGVFPEVDEAKQKLFDWGHKLEPIIIETYLTEAHPHYDFLDASYNKFLEDIEHPFICANIDSEVVLTYGKEADHYLIEAKTASYSEFQKWSNGVPLNYYGQAQWYLMVTGLNRLVFAILVMDSRKLETFEVIRDDDFIAKMRQTCIDFWNNHVLTNTPPELTVSDLEKVKPKPDSTILADKDEMILHAEIKELQSKVKDLESQIEARKNLVKEKMQDNGALCVEGVDKPLFTWKSQVSRSVDYAKLYNEYSDIYNQVVKETVIRKLLIK